MKTGLDNTQLLSQLSRMRELAQGRVGGINPGTTNPLDGNASKVNGAEFGNVLGKAIDTVNQYQKASAVAATQIEQGDGGVSLVKAMIASQKANIAFQATVQVRNKVVSAYQDIMNMPI
ncbi:MAG: flagellar hook-basal body complex protein FliE [Gammaproteobacteria bacterium]|nr:flagellar hook-basal body complex protein FliE [Gammaproteobacteria bacterium]MDH5630908.1 flagellar hook-basal body complex protein FliE [Gammaproteobacteria bacterium]